MIYTLISVYKLSNWGRIFGFLAMAILRIPFYFQKNCLFWKLFGCGKNLSVHLAPDYYHWAHLSVWEDLSALGKFQQSFICSYFNLFKTEQFDIILTSQSAHGFWDQKQPFQAPMEEVQKVEKPNKQINLNCEIAVITRATIHFNKIKEFKKNAYLAHRAMENAPGWILSIGMGENPINKQATLSIWQNYDAMIQFAYKDPVHAAIIQKTRNEKWYSEDLFARFSILKMKGLLNGKNYE